MHNNLSLAGLFDDAVQTPAGIIVPKHAAADLIKSEAKKLRIEENKAAFFSKFALAQNMVAYGAREKPMGTPQFPILYESARRSFIDAILIRARIDQTKRIWQKANDGKNKEIGFKVVHERHDDPDYEVTDQDKERCREMEKLLGDPTPTEYLYLYPHNVRPHTRLKDMVGVLTRAELIIDRKCLLRYKRRDGQGYAAFHWLPGETIKNVDESVRAWAQKNEANGKISRDTISKMSYATGFDIAKASYVQMIDGMVTAAFTDDEISVHISNPSDQMNRYGYGESRLEMSLDISTSLLLAFTYNREMFKTNYPEQILTVAGDFDPEGLKAFKQQLLSEAGGVGNNWRLPVIPSGDAENFKIDSVKLRESPKDMLFDTMIRMMCMLKCFKYDTVVETLEHGNMWIGKIVTNQMPVHIKSFDRATGQICWGKVTDWQKYKETKWVKLKYPGGNKRQSIDVTHDHDLWNGTEMVPAGSLKVGDTLYIESPTLTPEQEQIVLGSLLGDGTIRKYKKKDGTPSNQLPMLTESHSESQADYAEWKISAYANLEPKSRRSFTTAVKNGTKKYANISFHTKAFGVLHQYAEMCINEDGIKRVTWEWLNKIDRLGLAVWFMDDGAFHKQKQQNRYSASIALMPGTPEEMALYWRYFVEKWDLYPRITRVKNSKGWRLRFSVAETERLVNILADYIKIAPPISQFSATKKQWIAAPITVSAAQGLAPIKITEVTHYEIPKGQMCYDVTIDGTHTLFANGLASSNCAAYGAHPSTLNLDTDSGGGNSSIFAGNVSGEIEFSKEHGLIPSITDMAEWLTDAIVAPRYDDLKVVVVGLKPDDEKQAVELRTQRVSKWKTRNEARMEEGDKPIGDVNDPDNPWNLPADAPIMNQVTQQGMAQQQEGGDQLDDGEEEDYQKSLRKSQAEKKYLKISIN